MARVVPLPDGRRLGLAEYGDADGAPVFLFHGLPGSRLQFHPDPAVARGCGVRVLALERPGMGLSTPHPRRRIVDWPRDVAAAADALGLAKFGVMALSGGGPYGAACAALIPERLTSITFVSPLGPIDKRRARLVMAPLPGTFLGLARWAPWLLPLPAGIYLLLRHFPRTIHMARPWAGISASDRAALREMPEIGAMYRRDLTEATRQGYGGVLTDARLASRPWGFALDSIRVPVTLWYGDRDALTPPAMQASLARAIPHCRVHCLPGEGHFLFFRHLREILAAAREGLRTD